MEIIRKGTIQYDQEYIKTCNRCDTEFKFKRKEATETYDQRDRLTYLAIRCPVCNYFIYQSV